MIFKLCLCGVLFLSCSVIGFTMASSLDKRYRLLKELQSAVSILMSQLRYYVEPIPVAVERASQEINGEAGEIFKIMAELVEENGCADAFITAVNRKRLQGGAFGSLTDEDIDIFYDLFSRLGGNSDEQNAAFKLAEVRTEAAINEAYEIKLQKSKLYRTLGILTGALLCIILI